MSSDEIIMKVEIPGLDVTVDATVAEMIDDHSPYVGGLPYPLDRWGKKELDPELYTLVRYWQERAAELEDHNQQLEIELDHTAEMNNENWNAYVKAAQRADAAEAMAHREAQRAAKFELAVIAIGDIVDSTSNVKLRDFLDADGDPWFEVAPGLVVYEPTRMDAEEAYRNESDRAGKIDDVRGAWGLTEIASGRQLWSEE